MIFIHHGSHAVKAESIKMEFLLPVFQVGQQEIDHVVLAVVKNTGFPVGVPAPAAGQEILVICAVQLVQSFPDVRAGMSVHHVQQHGKPELMQSPALYTAKRLEQVRDYLPEI